MFYVEVRLPADELQRRVVVDDASELAFALGAASLRWLHQTTPEALEFDFATSEKGMEFTAALKNEFPTLPIMVFAQ